jgi:hypothetical protein
MSLLLAQIQRFLPLIIGVALPLILMACNQDNGGGGGGGPSY